MKTSLRFLSAPCGLAFFCFTSPATGQETETLAPVVVTASRIEESVLNSANSVSELTSEDFAKNGSRTLPEALGELPGVMVQKTAHGHGSPYIRGFTAFRNLLLVDGIRFNNSIFREGPNQYWNTIDPYSSDRMELVYGPGSTLYGSDAIGSTLNLFSKSSDFKNEDHGEFYQHGSVLYRFDTASESHVGRLEQEIGEGGKYGLHLGFSTKNFGDVRSADIGRQKNTGYDEMGYDLRFDYSVSENTTLTLLHQDVSQDDVWRTHKTIYGTPWQGSAVGNELRRSFDQNRNLSYLRLRGEEASTWLDVYEATLSFQRTEEERFRIRNDGHQDQQGFDVDTIGIALQMESDWNGGRLVYGFDFYRDNVDSFRIDYNPDGTFLSESLQGPVGDDATYDLLGIYLQNRWEMDQVTLTLGGRYTCAETEIGQVEDPATGNAFSIDESWDSAVFNFRANYELNDTNSIYAGISSAFRAPNLSDLSRLDSARSDEIEVASPGLDPETTLTYEIGLHHESDRARFNATVFYTDIRDGITRTPTGAIVGGETVVIKQNTGDGHVYGVELSGDWEFTENLSLFGNFSWIEGEQKTFATSAPVLSNEPLSRLAPAMGQLGVRWTHPDDKFWIEGLVKAAAKADKLSTRDKADTQRIPPGGTPSYIVPTVRGGWQVNEDTLCTLSLENLTNEDYRIHGSGLNEAGFNATLSVTLSW